MPTFLAIKNSVAQLHVLNMTALGTGFRAGIPSVYQLHLCPVVSLFIDKLTTDFVETVITYSTRQLVIRNHPFDIEIFDINAKESQ